MRRLLPPLIGLAVVLLLAVLRVADPYPVQVLREIAFDFYQQLKPRPTADYPVRVVDIDEASLAEIGQWPWPRDKLALLSDRLTELGAAAIGFDVLFPEPDRMSPSRIAATVPGIDPATLPDNDKLFAEALSRGPTVLGFSRVPKGPVMTGEPKSRFAISGPDPSAGVSYLTGVAAPLPELRAASMGLATLSLNSTLTSTAVRRLPMLWTDGTNLFPTLSLEALRIALGVPTMVVLGDTSAAGYVEGVRIGGYTVPLTSNGDLWLYYSKPRADLYVSAKDLLGDDYMKVADKIAGQIVLIGTSASGLLDIHATTLGDNVPGVSIHAQAIEQIISETYLTRPDWVLGLEIVGFVALGALMVLVVLLLGPVAGLAAGALSLGATVSFSWWMFSAMGVMFDPGFPLVGLTLLYLVLVYFRFLTTDVAKKQIRRAFGYYVDPSLLAEIEKNGDKLKLGGELREVTVMFSDVRGFTPLSEKLTPTQILALLNTMFGALGAEITSRFGTIDKFIGDAIMAFWNAPVDVPSHPQRACDAALGMRARLRALNEADAFALRSGGTGIDAVVVGVGISTGEALVGNMGLETRFDYSALGDTVNTASRVEGACKETGYDLLVTSATRDQAVGLAFLPAGGLALKGKAERVQIHLLVGDEALALSEPFQRLAVAHKAAIAALVAGEDMSGPLAACLALVPQVEPGLAKFYRQLPDRRADFAPAQPETVPEAAE
jgi:adenylate cyclase